MRGVLQFDLSPALRPWLRRLRTAATFFFAGLSFFVAYLTRPQPLPAYDVSRWLQDLWQLEDHVRHHYPNLSWAIETHVIDPPALHQYTVDAIKRARTNAEAERAIRAFVHAFRDRHFEVGRGDVPRTGRLERLVRGRPLRSATPAYACSFFQFQNRHNTGFLIPFEKLTGFEALPGAPDFPAGILTVGGRRVGIVRIGTFRLTDYADACRRSWANLRRIVPRPCDQECEYELGNKTAERILQELSERARQMQLARVDELIVDLTGNRGGNGWVHVATEMFVAGPLPANRVRFSRSEDVVGEFREMAHRIRIDLRRNDLEAGSRAYLENLLARARSLVVENRKPCDPGDIWGEPGFPMRCSNLTRTEYWTSGLSSIPPERLSAQWQSEYDVSYLRRYSAETHVYNGPIAVLVDRQTGSAAELFAGQLQDWAHATIIGERTAGAGGGWQFGDTPLVLRHTGLHVYVPDHATYRRDGSNTTAGVVPDVCVPWSEKDSPEIRARRVLREILSAEKAGGAIPSPGGRGPG